MELKKMEKRNDNLDALKFILIIFVIIGHAMQNSLYNMGEYEEALYRLIYSFHVPAFSFLSGYFTDNRKSYLNKAPILIETIVIGNICWYCMHDIPFDIGTLITPQYHLWYLAALVVWRLITYLLSLRCDGSRIIFVSLFLYMISAIHPIWHFGIYLTFTYFPFFAIGNFARNNHNTIFTLKNVNGGGILL